MKNRADILTEINGISKTVASIPFVNVFTVDETYFSSLTQVITAKINAADSLKNLRVPDGYFESLSGTILNAVTPQQAKVVTMRKRTVTTFIKYAVAAIFTGAMAAKKNMTDSAVSWLIKEPL